MSKIARYQGNVRAFASNAQGMERTVFGGTNQADDLTSQITASFLRGWGVVGASEHPSLEDFNAAMYAMSQFIAYQHQMGIAEWHAQQEYHIGSICTHNGESYQSLQNANVGSQPPSAKWTPVLTSKNGLANLHLEETVKLAKNALPLSGGRLTGPVSLLNENGKRLQIETAGNPTSNVFVVFTGTDERPCLIEFKDETSYHFFSQRNPDGKITFQAAGKMIPLDYSNFDAKYQAKGNYAVKGDSYTKEETNLKFENEKISGVGPFSFLDKTSGLILKAAGVTFATEGDRVTFPEAFPNICRAVVLTLNGSAGETNRNIVATNVSRTGFSIARGSNEAGVFWMAIGV